MPVSEAGKNSDSKMGANEQGQPRVEQDVAQVRVSRAGKDTGLYFTTVGIQGGAVGGQGWVTGPEGRYKDTSGHFGILRGRQVRKLLLQFR